MLDIIPTLDPYIVFEVTEIKVASSRTARRAAANREAIVDAAEELLIEGGLAAVTVEAVAERSDVAIQTVYNRVGRRPEVLVAIAERAIWENWRYMEPAFKSPGAPVKRLHTIAQAYVAFARDRPQQFELLNSPPDEPVALVRIADKVDEQIGLLADVLAEGVAGGSFDPALDPSVAATALWAMLEGVLTLGLRPDRKVVSREAVRDMAEFAIAAVIAGIAPPRQ